MWTYLVVRHRSRYWLLVHYYAVVVSLDYLSIAWNNYFVAVALVSRWSHWKTVLIELVNRPWDPVSFQLHLPYPSYLMMILTATIFSNVDLYECTTRKRKWMNNRTRVIFVVVVVVDCASTFVTLTKCAR